MFTVVSAEVVARKLIKDNEKIRNLVKIKNNKMLDSLQLSKNKALECRDVTKSQLLANLQG